MREGIIIFYEEIKLEKELIFENKVDFLAEHELHMHDLLEINVLKENQAQFKLLSKNYIGEPGDVFIFRPFEPHFNLAQDNSKPYNGLWCCFLHSL